MKKLLKAIGSFVLIALVTYLLVSFLHDTALGNSPGAFAPMSASSTK